MRTTTFVLSLLSVLALFFIFFVDGQLQSPVRSTYNKVAQTESYVNFERDTIASNALYFDQKLDHFNSRDSGTWKQKYYVNDSYWQPGGPVFFFLAGEAPAEFFEFQEVSALHWAQTYNAVYVSLEHRFYGDSQPLKDLKEENLVYLSSQQALSDAAYFLATFNTTSQYTKDYNAPWVVFGCSYSGALSAWFRDQYPHLVIGSVAPSGPIIAKVNFTEYFAQFTASTSPECSESAHRGSLQIEEYTRSDDGLEKLAEIFKSCKKIKQEDVYAFYYNVIGVVGSSDQMSNPPDWPLNKTCDILTDSSLDPIQAFAKAYFFNIGQDDESTSSKSDCIDYTEKSILDGISDKSAGNSDRAWVWQTCLEFGFYTGSYPSSSVFPYMSVDRQVEWCNEVFSKSGFDPISVQSNINATNRFYGGYNIGKSATNIMFTNGLKDPWHHLSVNEDLSEGVKAVTYDAGHCGTMIAPSPIDPPSLTAARSAVSDFLGNILQANANTTSA